MKADFFMCKFAFFLAVCYNRLMELTSKTRYAVRVMVDIAKTSKDYLSIAEISEKENISIKYLEKIIGMLSRAGLVESMRGASGGYKLVKKPSEYSLKEIFDATGDSPKMAACVDRAACPKCGMCDTEGVFNALNQLINDFLSNTSLEQLMNKTFKGN